MIRVLPMLLCAAVACGQGAAVDSGADFNRACDDGEPFDAYVDGLGRATTNGVHQLALTSDPGPPDVGQVGFVIEVDGGAMLDGVVELRPWMPLHGHGTVPEILSGAHDGSGSYAFEPVDLFMPGLWELHVSVDALGDGQMDEGLYRFCLEG